MNYLIGALFYFVMLTIGGFPFALLLYFFLGLHQKINIIKFLLHFVLLILLFTLYLQLSPFFQIPNSYALQGNKTQLAPFYWVSIVSWFVFVTTTTMIYGRKILKLDNSRLLVFVCIVALLISASLSYN